MVNTLLHRSANHAMIATDEGTGPLAVDARRKSTFLLLPNKRCLVPIQAPRKRGTGCGANANDDEGGLKKKCGPEWLVRARTWKLLLESPSNKCPMGTLPQRDANVETLFPQASDGRL